MNSHDVIDTIRPELDALVAACQVEPDERLAWATAAGTLMHHLQQMIEANDTLVEKIGCPTPDEMVAAIQLACMDEDERDYWAALQTIIDFNVWRRNEKAKLN